MKATLAAPFGTTRSSVAPPDAEGETLSVELVLRADRQLKIECAGVTLSATLPAQLPAPAVLDGMFENALKFADEAAGVPVLLSMLVLPSAALRVSMPTTRPEGPTSSAKAAAKRSSHARRS